MSDVQRFPQEEFVDVTGVDLVKLTQEVYARSGPQGLGYMHYLPGPLPEEEARAIVEAQNRAEDRVPLHLDYLKGRACKMVVWRSNEGKLYIRRDWFDHTEEQMQSLLQALRVCDHEEGTVEGCTGCFQ